MKTISLTGTHTFNIIPRDFVSSIDIKLTSETTNQTIEITVDSVTDGNYLEFSADFGTLTESDFYTLDIFTQSQDLIYKDRVFATAQTIDQLNNNYYTVNKDVYVTEDSADNDFIVI